MGELRAVLRVLEGAQAEAVPFVLLGLCLAAAVAAWWGYYRRRRKRRQLWARQRDLDTLRAMTWQEFEQLTGETFRRLGYVVAETGGGGADGGLDLLLTKDGRRFAVQCKHYNRTKAGAPVVRDAVGVAVHVRAAAVFVVALAGFTRQAHDYAKGKPVHLIDGQQLLRLIARGRI